MQTGRSDEAAVYLSTEMAWSLYLVSSWWLAHIRTTYDVLAGQDQDLLTLSGFATACGKVLRIAEKGLLYCALGAG